MCGYDIKSVSISKGGQHMKLLKLLLVFVLILNLTACLALPIDKWQLNNDRNETEQNQETHREEEAEDSTGEQQAEENDIDDGSNMDTINDINPDEKEDVNEVEEVDEKEEMVEIEEIDEEKDTEEVDDKEKIEETADQEEPNQGLELVQIFNTQIPENITVELKYDKYLISYDYLLMLKNANIRQLPTVEGDIIGNIGSMERIPVVAEVKGDYLEEWGSDSWYQVEWEEKGEFKTGFIFSGLAEVRKFQFDKMVESIEVLEQSASSGPLAYISNYKNANGIPPKINGQTWDSYGYRRSQSAAGYLEPNKSSKFRYIPDGMLVEVLDKKNGFTKVKVVGFEGEYWVLDKYINTKKTLTKLNKVIIVDRKNQNQGVFELIDGKWTLISYGLSTTGVRGTYSLETPLGYYMAIEKRDKFLYLEDGTTKIAGYAPYAIRFSGGGYIHGVPVNYKMENGKRIDPGMIEYLHSIGTTPRSHMCVRNYTSHAKFLHSWADIGETAFIVIE